MDKTQEFITKAKKFIVQAVTGQYMTFFRMTKKFETDKNKLKFTTMIYLNDCWHKYNKKNDKYIEDTYDSLLKIDLFKNVICLTHWLNHIIATIIDEMNYIAFSPNSYKNLDFVRGTISKFVSDIYDNKITSMLKTWPLVCCGKKDIKYDGNDIYKFEK